MHEVEQYLIARIDSSAKAGGDPRKSSNPAKKGDCWTPAVLTAQRGLQAAGADMDAQNGPNLGRKWPSEVRPQRSEAQRKRGIFADPRKRGWERRQDGPSRRPQWKHQTG